MSPKPKKIDPIETEIESLKQRLDEVERKINAFSSVPMSKCSCHDEFYKELAEMDIGEIITRDDIPEEEARRPQSCIGKYGKLNPKRLYHSIFAEGVFVATRFK